MIFGDIPIVRATRKKCPVCGHPTGDCAGGNNPDVVDVSGREMADPSSNLIRAPRTVTKEVELGGGASATKILVKKGELITIDKARELGLL